MTFFKNIAVAAAAFIVANNASANVFFTEEAAVNNAPISSFAELMETKAEAQTEEFENYVELKEVAPEAAEVETSATDEVVVVDTTKISDFEYVSNVQRKTLNYDYRSVEIDGQKVLLEVAPNCGVEIGVKAGADYFNGNFTPTVGGELGYHGRNFGIWAGVEFGISKYNSESDRAGEKYMMTNFTLDAGVKLFSFGKKHGYLHQNEFWLIGQFGYKVRKNHNAYETETETSTSSLMTHVKGSTMTFGGGFRIDFKNYFKKSNIYLKAVVYAGQEYFADGSKERIGASVSLGYNFVCGKTQRNTPVINKLFGSTKAYKQALKAKRTLQNY